MMRLRSFIACAALAAGAFVALPAATAAAATTRYEAETAPATCDGTIDSNHSGYSGTGFCNAGNAVGAAAQFTVNAPAAGAATVAVRFANGTTTSRPATLMVDGSTVQSVSFEGTGAWSTWVTNTLSVSVSSGSNTIRFSPTASGGLPNIDFIDVTTDGTTPPGTALYVATNGNDSNAGTLAQPLRTIQRAVDLAQPGHTILLRGGTYAPSTNIQLLKNGTASAPITMTTYNGERVVIDGENMPHTPAPVDGSIPRPERGAIHIEGDYWRLIGLEIINGPYAVFGLDTNNNVFERLITRDNYESGLHLQGASSNNQIINLDAYGNRDPRNNGESADGLAIKEGSGTGNVVRGARLWNNSDDGLDFWEFLSPVTVENSIAYGNGFNRWNLPDYTGDGNGFKLGGGDEDLPAAHVVRNSMAWDNATGGFIDNANPGQMVIDHCTAWDNPGTGFDFADADATLTKNLAVANGVNVSLGANSSGTGNSWNLGGSWSFAGTDPSIITGPRNADGSIRTSTFLRPANGADVGARL
ncbi:right-handed parallel beta-helix repeat-containing protein [Nonomuraea sp. 10N515B]|uniref:right-handed parallel beta-helix repeat-containing protein n=1 Tax=Nonomuraea sp. 10N515B TaxID=3457422 RepID=UPI003FCD8508